MNRASQEDKKKKKKRRPHRVSRITNALIEHVDNQRKITVNNVMDTMMQMVPRALQVKEEILNDPLSSDSMKNLVASDILDRTVPKPTQSVNIKAAMVTANMTDRELKDLVMQKIQGAAN